MSHKDWKMIVFKKTNLAFREVNPNISSCKEIFILSPLPFLSLLEIFPYAFHEPEPVFPVRKQDLPDQVLATASWLLDLNNLKAQVLLPSIRSPHFEAIFRVT